MAKKVQQEEVKAGAPAWTTSFSDMMSLLLCFFVLLFAMSELDQVRVAAILESMGNPNINVVQPSTGLSLDGMLGSGIMEMPSPDDGVHEEEILAEHAYRQEALRSIAIDFITHFLEQELSENISVSMVDEEVRLTFTDMLFASGSAVISPSVIEILDYVAQVLAEHPFLDIWIEGHTDNVPINTIIFPSNWHLSAARAIAVMEHLVEQNDVPVGNVVPVAMGEFTPVDDNSTAEGRQNNRRVEIAIRTQ